MTPATPPTLQTFKDLKTAGEVVSYRSAALMIEAQCETFSRSLAHASLRISEEEALSLNSQSSLKRQAIQSFSMRLYHARTANDQHQYLLKDQPLVTREQITRFRDRARRLELLRGQLLEDLALAKTLLHSPKEIAIIAGVIEGEAESSMDHIAKGVDRKKPG